MFSLATFIQVALGGAIGASARYLVTIGSARMFGTGFPVGTLVVNVLGSFLMGLCAVLAVQRGFGAWQPLVMTGVLGVPEGTYAGLGNRGQHMVIVPARDLVIVRRGYDVAGQDGFDIAAFTRDVVAAFDAAEAARLEQEALAAAAEAAETETFAVSADYMVTTIE